MALTVVIEPLANREGFSARLAAPIDLSAEASTADDAHSRLSALLEEKLQHGLELREIPVQSHTTPAPGGKLPDDELTNEWLQHMSDYRHECEAEDLARLESDGTVNLMHLTS